MKNYAIEFQGMIESLLSDPDISVVSSYIFPGASNSEILHAEEILRCRLDETLRTFYQQCNGLQLRWIRKDSEDFNESEFGTHLNAPISLQDIIEDDNRLDGCINIFPLQTVVSKGTGIKVAPDSLYVDTYIILSQAFKPLEFCNNAFVFDGYDVHRGIVLFPIRSQNMQLCMLGSLSYTMFQNSKKVKPMDYLDFVLATKGATQSRMAAFKLLMGMLNPSIDELEY
jgi:hypothetical protein